MDDKTSTETRGPAAAAERNRPTLKTIAFMTGLGVTTVSRALKDAPDIGIETRKRVKLVADQVGYRPNRAGVRLRKAHVHARRGPLVGRETSRRVVQVLDGRGDGGVHRGRVRERR